MCVHSHQLPSALKSWEVDIFRKKGGIRSAGARYVGKSLRWWNSEMALHWRWRNSKCSRERRRKSPNIEGEGWKLAIVESFALDALSGQLLPLSPLPSIEQSATKDIVLVATKQEENCSDITPRYKMKWAHNRSTEQKQIRLNPKKTQKPCAVCNDDHWHDECRKYITVPQRLARLLELSACLNFLRKNHPVRYCKFSIRC